MTCPSCYSVIDNLIINCGFETGLQFPWEFEKGINNTAVVSSTTENPSHCGKFLLSLGNIIKLKSISQTLTLVPGISYTVSYWIYKSSPTHSSDIFRMRINGDIIPSTVLPSGYTSVPYSKFIYTFTATSILTTIQFDIRLNPQKDATPILLDDISITAITHHCYSGTSLALVKHRQTGKVEEIPVKEVRSSYHDVFDLLHQQFIPVVLNVITDPASNVYRLIPKDFFEENVPNNDFYITGGHKVVVNGTLTKVRDIPGIKRKPRFRSALYTICTEEQVPIQINNMPVLTWGYQDWLDYSHRKNIHWYNAGF